jgi:signal transduction histidine kinase/AmiR/NasT family two-component response regulator
MKSFKSRVIKLFEWAGAHKYLLGFVPIAAILLTITLVSYRSIQSVESLIEKRAKKRQIVLEAEKLAILMLQADIAFRDFIKNEGQGGTLDEVQLTKEIRLHLATLVSVSRGTASEADCDKLAKLVVDRERELLQVQANWRNRKKDLFVAQNLIQREKEHFLKIHALAKHIEVTQKNKMREIDDEVVEIVRANFLFVVIGAVCSIGLVVVCAVHLHSHLRQKTLAEAKLKEAHDLALGVSEAKTNFIANISHEIRTPINGVIGMTTLLDLSSPREDQKQYINTIRSSSQVLLTLINDLLDFSKAESGRVEIEVLQFDIRSLVEDTIDLFAEVAERKGLLLSCEFSPEVPKQLLTDPTRYRQILSNLISNAIKFTENGEVSVSVSVEKHASEQVKLVTAVNDTGIGISESSLTKLFQPFSQADASTTRKFGGTGLGLSICRRLTELLGGEMKVESRVNKGSKFAFSIRALAVEEALRPRAKLDEIRSRVISRDALFSRRVRKLLENRGIPFTEEPLYGPQILVITDGSMGGVAQWENESSRFGGVIFYGKLIGDHPKNSARMRTLPQPLKPKALYEAIAQLFLGPTQSDSSVLLARELKPSPRWKKQVTALLAEDNPINQRVAVRFLEELGIRTDLAGNGVEALDLFEKGSYDLVLMDCQMPEKDGFETTRELRTTSKGRNIPIIALTASVSEGAQRKCAEAGMDAFIPKPIDFKKLSDVLSQRLGFLAVSSFDRDQLQSLASLDRAGERKMFEELFAIFSDSLPKLLAEMDEAFRVADLQRVSRIAHRLKGSSYQLGAAKLADICGKLEVEARSEETADKLTLIRDELRQEVGNVLDEGRRLASAPAGRGEASA